ncbi:MAG: proton-conducting transporter transmembrane domain-containing protein [Nitrospiria bacterium]
MAGLIIGLLGRRIGQKIHRIGVLAQVVAFVVSLQTLHEVVTLGSRSINLSLFTSPSSSILHFGFYIDRLAVVMMVLITAISTIIHLYSIRYMQQERGYSRFYALLGLTTFALLCMVSSGNLFMLFIFWQLLSWLLYLLLAYNYSHSSTIQVAFKTYIVLRAGDVVFLSGIVLAYGLYGTLDFRELFTRATEAPASLSLWPGGGFSVRAATAITLLIFVGAMSKSAQFPLHGWLPDSMYTPTPVSALMHAGIINAGGFLLNRLAPLYGLSPVTLHIVFAVGLLTALLGASMMLTQNDIKKTLGYSTIGQMGYMIMECGLGAFSLAIFHLIAHGLFKATIFLNSGHVIHAARQEPRFPSKDETTANAGFLRLAWITGFVTTLILPLTIMLAAHGVLSLPFRNSQGIVIFLFFSWVTSSQAILTLYRVRAVASWKVAALMLLTLLLVVSTYLLAAESFTYFLYPVPGEVAAYFQAAALPGWLFDLMVGATALAVILGWILLYAKSHGRTLLMPEWAQRRVNVLQVRLYILFMNRLYLDALALRFGRRFTAVAHRLDTSGFFPYVVGLIALGLVWPTVVWTGKLSAMHVALFVVAALMLPLFPLHGVYVAALTRLPGYWPVCLAVLLPAAGLYGLTGLLPGMPAEYLRGVNALALFGALYGSFKSLAQVRVSHLLAYAGLAFFSILWWYLAVTGISTPQAAVYTGAVTLVIGGLLLAWHCVQARYGDLDLNQIGGLARPMPRFATLLALLVMAAVGLPPFGLFSGYMAMLFHPSITLSWDMIVILLTWLVASWYLFRLMQRLLFGPHRSDILYEDLRPAEAAPLLIVLFILLALGIMPYGFFESDTLKNSYRSAMEFMLWNR